MLATDSLPHDAAGPPVPRPFAWLLLGGAAAAALAVGLVTTAAVLSDAGPRSAAVPPAFWLALAAALAATCISLGLRTLRWVFLLRRAGVRIPIRDACIGYLSGLSLLLVPLLLGEFALRASVQRSRAGVAPATTIVVNAWERLLDVVALACIAAAAAGALAGPQAAVLPLTIVAATATGTFRRFTLSSIVGIVNAGVRRISIASGEARLGDLEPVAQPAAWLTALTASVAVWLLPGLALWLIAGSLGGTIDFARSQLAYASATLTGALRLAPGGVRVVGTSLIDWLTAGGMPREDAALALLALRLATIGLATALGAAFVWVHVRSRVPQARDSHFDDLAHAYDAQIPAAQREALLARKTELMRDALAARGIGRRGLDVGCGQGWYVARMRTLGFDVHGIDASAGQVARARRNVGDAAAIGEGSVLHIDAPDEAFDFAYVINVLHHLPSAVEQRAAFAELLRVLRPGGLMFLHEINTRNVLFRFYMGYVFPSLNCIDEGTERWLLPNQLAAYTATPVVATEYFTFMPEFVPAALLRLLRPLERLLERSPLRVYSAHYMAVLQKPASPA